MEKYRIGRDGRQIVESSLSRVYTHFTLNSAVAISACRDEYSEEENNKRTDGLESELKRSKWGFIPMVGGYIEKTTNQDGEEEDVEVQEYSFLIPFPNQRERTDDLTEDDRERDFEALVEYALDLANRYEQESILVVDNGRGYYYYYTNGDVEDAGTFSLKPEDEKLKYFSMLAKGNHRRRKWVFEGYLGDSHTFFGKQAQYVRGEVKR